MFLPGAASVMGCGACQIPYIGWILGAIAVAPGFAGVEAFGSAEGANERLNQPPSFQGTRNHQVSTTKTRGAVRSASVETCHNLPFEMGHTTRRMIFDNYRDVVMQKVRSTIR